MIMPTAGSRLLEFAQKSGQYHIVVRTTMSSNKKKHVQLDILAKQEWTSSTIPYFFVEIEAANSPQIVHASFRGFR